MYVGGTVHSNIAETTWDGVSYAYVAAGMGYSTTTIGSRLAFVMDVIPQTKTVTLTTDGSGYGSLDGTISFTVDPGSTITISGDTVTVGLDTTTAEPLTNTAQYTYAFVNWTINGTPVTGSYTVNDDVTIQANFSRTTNTYTVTTGVSPANTGTVDVQSVASVPYGTLISAVNNVASVGSIQDVTATPASPGVQYHYIFDKWQVDGTDLGVSATVTGNTTLTAIFDAVLNEFTATIESNNTTWGTVSTGSVPNIPYGTVLHLGQDDSLIIGNVADPIATITVSPAAQTVRYTYAFTGYDVQDGDVITGDQTIVATFSQTERTYTVSVLTNDQTRGTVYPVVILNVPGETYFQVNGQTITLDSQSSTATIAPATAQYTYAFDGWFTAASGGTAITNSTQVLGDMDVYAVFSATTNTYTVTAGVSPSGYGSVDVPSLASVPYGTLITVSDNVATVGSTDVTATIAPATAQYTYSFVKWQYGGQDIGVSATVEGNGTLTAVFTRTTNTYTITWDVDGTTTQETYAYGDTPSTTAPTKPNYTFNGWNPSIHSVTGDQTYTATWYATTYTITWDPTEGAFPNQPSHTATTTGSVETPAPLPSTDPVYAHYDFAGWFSEIEGGDALVTPYYPTENKTWYAHWDAVVYTVTFDANGGQGTPEPLDGSADTPILLPATVPSVPTLHFSGWYTAATGGEYVGAAGSYYIPTADITLYAHFSENVDYSFSLYLDPNTGYGGPGVINAKTQTDVPYEFTIPSKEPVKYLMTFDGWATTPDATESEYSAGDTVSVDPNARLTLYAVWSEGEGHDDFKAIIGVIPILAGVGIVIGAASMLYSKSRRTELTTKDFITATLGIAISVIVLALVMVPIIGGL